MLVIESVHNQTLIQLIKSAKNSGHKAAGFWLEGPRAIDEFLERGAGLHFQPDCLCIAQSQQRGLEKSLKRYVHSLEGQDMSVEVIQLGTLAADKFAKALGGFQSSQGLWLHVKPLFSQNSDLYSENCSKAEMVHRLTQPNSLHLILEQIQDPGNLGTLLRSAKAFGVSSIFCSDGCAHVYSPKVLRSSLSAALALPIFEAVSLTDLADLCSEANVQLVATSLKGRDLHDFIRDASKQDEQSQSYAILIGNEGRGLSQECLQAAQTVVTIPMSGGFESLNAAVAGSIVLYEFSRLKALREE